MKEDKYEEDEEKHKKKCFYRNGFGEEPVNEYLNQNLNLQNFTQN